MRKTLSPFLCCRSVLPLIMIILPQYEYNTRVTLNSTIQLWPLNSRSNWNLEMLFFEERGKPEYLEKNPQSRDENQQQTQPTFDAESGNQTQAGGRPAWEANAQPLHHPCFPMKKLNMKVNFKNEVSLRHLWSP